MYNLERYQKVCGHKRFTRLYANLAAVNKVISIAYERLSLLFETIFPLITLAFEVKQI